MTYSVYYCEFDTTNFNNNLIYKEDTIEDNKIFQFVIEKKIYIITIYKIIKNELNELNKIILFNSKLSNECYLGNYQALTNTYGPNPCLNSEDIKIVNYMENGMNM